MSWLTGGTIRVGFILCILLASLEVCFYLSKAFLNHHTAYAESDFRINQVICRDLACLMAHKIASNSARWLVNGSSFAYIERLKGDSGPQNTPIVDILSGAAVFWKPPFVQTIGIVAISSAIVLKYRANGTKVT